jgi:hypothetical protein
MDIIFITILARHRVPWGTTQIRYRILVKLVLVLAKRAPVNLLVCLVRMGIGTEPNVQCNVQMELMEMTQLKIVIYAALLA